ncbi:MAG TPA: DUF1549 and DUF1553 domain-containing protein [Planctomycetaceae bacterium]|nr:DUF1549 and DUF1553 domain-containing protein [Planctomycetaceae bacterium]
MSRTLTRVGIALLVCSAGALRAAEPKSTAAPIYDPAEVQALADLIDQRIGEVWKRENVVPATAADDLQFLRRVSLDVGGRIPAVSEVRAYLADQSPEKRRAVVDRLLDSPAYVVHFTSVWRAVMLPEADADLQLRFLLPNFEAWLRQRLIDGVAYDELVRELLTIPLTATGPNPQSRELTPIAYYQAKQLKAENLAAGTARTFLGVRIECAQCHDHPFDHWKREEFWSYASFFAGVERPAGPEGQVMPGMEDAGKHSLKIPGSEKIVQAAFLGGAEPKWEANSNSRKVLADWLTADENPYFARAAVNRLWSQFFGTGLVDPVDDFCDQNRPSHPELLDELARSFVAHRYDVKFMIRAITSSRAYQLSSIQNDRSQQDPHRFARMPLRGLTPAQLFDSLAQATGYYERFENRNPLVIADNTPRAEFLESFGQQDGSGATERATTILQALVMMNGRFVSEATSIDKSATLTALNEFPLMTTRDRLETIYLAALCRQPTTDELDKMTKYVDGGGPTKDSKRALGDVFWALLNASEFLFNH